MYDIRKNIGFLNILFNYKGIWAAEKDALWGKEKTLNSLDDIWTQVLEMLGENLTPVAITTWFKDCKLLDLLDTRAVICVPSEFKKRFIEERFLPAIKEAFSQIFACEFEITLLGEGALTSYVRKNVDTDMQNDSLSYTFDRFVVGSSNKFAHAAAMAVAYEQTKDYNPLFIHGNSGLGKTHLLYAIRNEIRDRHPEYKIVYVKGDDFTNEMIKAISTGKNMEFREKYRYADLFLMDDIQFIAGKVATEEEFFHTFNSLYEANRQIVFTSDRPPQEMTQLTDRLKTRFESGLIVDIQPPDYETRMAIIRNKANQLGITIPDDASNYVAEKLKSNVRQIEGAVKLIKAHKDLNSCEITYETVKKVIDELVKDKVFVATPDLIIDECAKYYTLDVEDIKGNSRSKNILLARQVSMFLMRRLTDITLQEIGEVFGGKDHATVLNSIKKMEDKVNSSRDFSQVIKDITANINAHV